MPLAFPDPAWTQRFMETPSELFVSGLPLPSRVYNTWCQHRPRSLAPRSRAAHTVASWTPERCALVLHRHIVPQLPPVASVRGNNPCPAAALPPRLCEAPPGTVAEFVADHTRTQGTTLPPGSRLPAPRPHTPMAGPELLFCQGNEVERTPRTTELRRPWRGALPLDSDHRSGFAFGV